MQHLQIWGFLTFFPKKFVDVKKKQYFCKQLSSDLYKSEKRQKRHDICL